MAKQTYRTLTISPSPTGGWLLSCTVSTNDGSRKQVLLGDNLPRVVADATAEAFQRAQFAFSGVFFEVVESQEVSDLPARQKATAPV